MSAFYKLLLFFTIGASFLVLAYIAFRYFNRKLTASETTSSYLLNAFLLVLINVILLLAGFFAVLRVYAFFGESI